MQCLIPPITLNNTPAGCYMV